MHKLIVMMGPAGCGKSTLALQFQSMHANCCIVSRDAIRFSLLQPGEENFAHEWQVIQTFFADINEALRDHEYVIADATHISRKARNRLWKNINLTDVEVIGIWVETPLQITLIQNAKRDGRACVPEDVIKDMYVKKVSPQEDEPFDKIIFVNSEYNLTSMTGDEHLMSVIDRFKTI